MDPRVSVGMLMKRNIHASAENQIPVIPVCGISGVSYFFTTDICLAWLLKVGRNGN
jgi:hypothetical protein